MSRIRIQCKAPPREPGALGFIVSSFQDLSVTLISDDGTETEITNVQDVRFEVSADTEPARAVLTFVDVDIDAEVEIVDEFTVDSAGAVHREVTQ